MSAQSPELVRIRCAVRRTTPEAVLIRAEPSGVSTWIPRSTIVGDITLGDDGHHSITLRQWIAKQKGLL